MSARRRELSLQPSKLTAEEAQWGLPLYDADFAALAAKVEEKLQKLLLALLGGIVSPMRAGGGDADLLRERDSLKEQVADAVIKIVEMTKAGSSLFINVL